MNTKEVIGKLRKDNLFKAINICKATGDGDFAKGLDIIKKKYDERPFDLAWADLKTVIDVVEGALNNDSGFSSLIGDLEVNEIMGYKCDKVLIDGCI